MTRKHPRPRLADHLELMVITHPSPACGRALTEVVDECLAAGATAVQLRDKSVDARELVEQARALVAVTRRHAALLIVNDRLDVAVAANADGVHLGPDDLPVPAARAIAPPGFVIGYSTDDPDLGRDAAEQGADYLGVGAVYGTRSKPGLEHEAIGPARVGEVARAAGIPCLGVGGITPETSRAVFEQDAGIAVISCVMAAERPGDVVRDLLAR